MKTYILLAAAAARVALGSMPAANPLFPFLNPGCGKHQSTGWSNDTNDNSLQVDNYTRTWGVNVPDHYNSNNWNKWPVIFDYHGAGGSSWTQYENSMYYKYNAGQDYLVIYPQGVNGYWQGPNYSDPNVNDLLFTSNLLQHIESTYCIDNSRVYASGKSNGAGFVDLLACSDNGDDFAAFAMASAALYTDLSESSCSKKRAILESHGDLDTTIPYHPTGPGLGGPLPDIGQWVSWWGERTCGNSAKPDNSGKDNSETDGGYDTTMYSCDGYQNVISHYQVFEMGHCWPSSTSTNTDATRNTSVIAHCLDTALDFTPVVLEFFGNWSMWNAPNNRANRWGWLWGQNGTEAALATASPSETGSAPAATTTKSSAERLPGCATLSLSLAMLATILVEGLA